MIVTRPDTMYQQRNFNYTRNKYHPLHTHITEILELVPKCLLRKFQTVLRRLGMVENR